MTLSRINEKSPSIGIGKTEPLKASLTPEAAAFIQGTWVTSFSTFVHDDPIDTQLTSRFVTYNYVEDPEASLARNPTSPGYMPSANLVCLKFLVDGKLLGKAKLNRGGNDVHEAGDYTRSNGSREDFFPGEYSCDFNSTLETYEGEFATRYVLPKKDEFGNESSIYVRYYYVASGQDELSWLWLYSKKIVSGADEGFHRASVASGTLKRVPTPLG